jgi:hypothetical protein
VGAQDEGEWQGKMLGPEAGCWSSRSSAAKEEPNTMLA